MKYPAFLFYMEKTVKCRAGKRCLHNGEPIPVSKAVTDEKGLYYHPDCLETKKNCKKIVDIFVEELNPNVIFNQLNSVINTLVFERGIDSEMLLYGIRWCINHGWNLRYPQGLYRVMQEQRWQDEYKNKQTAKAQKVVMEIKEDMPDNVFEYSPLKQQSFADILQ